MMRKGKYAWQLKPSREGYPAALLEIVGPDGCCVVRSRLNPSLYDTAAGAVTYGLLRECGLFGNLLYGFHDMDGLETHPDEAPVTYWSGWKKPVWKRIDEALEASRVPLPSREGAFSAPNDSVAV